jgi:surface polysaccharide O-acyltransferase-like enzyme
MSQKSGAQATTVLVAVIALICSFIVVSWLLETKEHGPALRLALALAAVAAWIFALIAYYRLIRQLDELARRIHLEALAFAFSGMAVAMIACEYLRKAGFISALKPDYVLMMMMILWALGFVIAWRRYR